MLRRLRTARDELTAKVIAPSNLSKGTTKTWAQIKKSDGDDGVTAVMHSMKSIKDDLEAIEQDAAFLIESKEKRDSRRGYDARERCTLEPRVWAETQ